MNISNYINDLTFADKDFFWLFTLLPIMITWYLFTLKKQEAEMNYSSFQNLGNVKNSFKYYLRHLIFVFRLIAVSLIIVVLARPQSRSSSKDIKTEGIDIVLS